MIAWISNFVAQWPQHHTRVRQSALREPHSNELPLSLLPHPSPSSAATAKGAVAIDAPVSGGDVGARNAALSIMVGGEWHRLWHRVMVTQCGAVVGCTREPVTESDARKPLCCRTNR